MAVTLGIGMADVPNTVDAALRGTAYHEAGHCVTAIVHGLGVEYVTIVPDKGENALRQAMDGKTQLRCPTAPQSTEERQAEINGLLMVQYAGALCESAITGKPVDPSTVTADHIAAKRILAAYHGCDVDSPTVQCELRRLYLATAEFLAAPKVVRAVHRVAKALLERHTLTGDEVRHIVLPESEDGPNA